MTDTPKFTVVDRRKFRGEESESSVATVPEPPAASSESVAEKPRLTLVETPARAAVAEPEQAAEGELESGLHPIAVADEEEAYADEDSEISGSNLPPAPSPEEFSFQKAAYDKAAERLEDLIRAQNPAAPHSEKLGYEHLVQQLYLSAMMQMGAGTPEGQRPRIDILGARQSIDLLGVLHDRTKDSITALEARTIETVIFDVRATFLELTRMIASQPMPPMPPPPGSIR
jgi:hypothetical protein